jgi:hypothetical protein
LRKLARDRATDFVARTGEGVIGTSRSELLRCLLI